MCPFKVGVNMAELLMTRGFSREEVMAVGRNLRIICEAEIKGEPLALTNAAHLLALSASMVFGFSVQGV